MDKFPVMRKHTEIAFETEYIIIVHDPEGWSVSYWGGGGGGGKFWLMFLNSPYSHLYGISVTNIFQIRTFFSQVNLALNIYTITNLLLLTTHIPHIS